MNARHLAAHTSGLPHYNAEDLTSLGRTSYQTSRAAVAIFEGRPQIGAPGAAYSYSSWGYTLLGAMVEQRAECCSRTK